LLLVIACEHLHTQMEAVLMDGKTTSPPDEVRPRFIDETKAAKKSLEHRESRGNG